MAAYGEYLLAAVTNHLVLCHRGVSLLLAAPQMLQHHLDEPHFSWHPLWEWLGQPALSLPFLLGSLALALALALSALPCSYSAATYELTGPLQDAVGDLG